MPTMGRRTLGKGRNQLCLLNLAKNGVKYSDGTCQWFSASKPFEAMQYPSDCERSFAITKEKGALS